MFEPDQSEFTFDENPKEFILRRYPVNVPRFFFIRTTRWYRRIEHIAAGFIYAPRRHWGIDLTPDQIATLETCFGLTLTKHATAYSSAESRPLLNPVFSPLVTRLEELWQREHKVIDAFLAIRPVTCPLHAQIRTACDSEEQRLRHQIRINCAVRDSMRRELRALVIYQNYLIHSIGNLSKLERALDLLDFERLNEGWWMAAIERLAKFDRVPERLIEVRIHSLEAALHMSFGRDQF
jgi:hypothetical protein